MGIGETSTSRHLCMKMGNIARNTLDKLIKEIQTRDDNYVKFKRRGMKMKDIE